MSPRLASIILAALLLGACAQPPPPAVVPEQRELRIYNWDTYIDPEIIRRFEAKFNVRVHYDTYNSNDEILAALSGDGEPYDIVVPSDYMVGLLRRQGLLSIIDHNAIPNLSNLDPMFANPVYDPGLRYCVPYQWGTQGIGYNIDVTLRPVLSWADLLLSTDPGRVSLLSDARSTMGVTLIYLGYSPNTLNPVEIEAAKDFLKRRARYFTFAADDGQDRLLTGEVDMAMEWSGDILQAMDENPALRYVVPYEGSIIWTDSMCVPHNAASQDLAEAFINFLLDPEESAALSNYTHYSSPNRAALPLINPADRNNPALYPDEQMRRRLFFLVDLGSDGAALYAEAWDEIMAAR